MLEIKKTWVEGWIVLPCFTVKTLENSDRADMTCCAFLQRIFSIFFAPFWNGEIHVTKIVNKEK